MKKSLTCPKCAGKKIWRVEQVNERPDGATHPQALAVQYFGGTQRGYHAAGHFEVFICGECGFAEWYAADLVDLKPDDRHGVHLIDGTER